MATNPLVAIQVRLSSAEARLLKALAVKSDRSLAAQTRIAIREHIARERETK
jgi:predicted transcriptional regulator